MLPVFIEEELILIDTPRSRPQLLFCYIFQFGRIYNGTKRTLNSTITNFLGTGFYS